MVDGSRVLADVRAKTIQPSWRVLRGRRWRALRYSIAAALVAIFFLLNLVTTFAGLPLPLPSSMAGAVALIVGTVIGVIGVVTLITPVVDSRKHAVVLLTEGFVEGNLRTGKVYRCVTYAAISRLSFGWDDLAGMGLVLRPYLRWLDERGQTTRWTLPAYLTVPPVRLATSILIHHLLQAQGSPADEQPDPSSEPTMGAAEMISLARKGQAPPSWQVIQLRQRPTRWTRRLVRYFGFPITVLFVAFLLACWGGAWYLLYGTLFISGFTGSTSALAVAGASVAVVFLLVLLTLALGYFLVYVVPELLSAYRRITVVTTERVVIGDRYTGAVLDAFGWPDVTNLDIAQAGPFYIQRFRIVGRKPITLRFFIGPSPLPYYTEPAGQMVQAVIERFAKSRSGATAAWAW